MAQPSAMTRRGALPPAERTNLELVSWLFMRLSGLALLFLALGHLAIMHLIATVDAINYTFVAARWELLAWRVYDTLLLVFAMLHGANGARVVIDDYLPRGRGRLAAVTALGAATLLFTLVGAITILAFPVTHPPGPLP